MQKRRGIKIAVAAAVLVGSLFLARHLLLPPVPSHRGDGTFQGVPWFGIVPVRGYTISMPELDLGRPHQVEYRVAGLTDIGQPCGVYLVIHDEDRRLSGDTKKLNGELRFDLVDSRGRMVADVNGRLGDFVWWSSASQHGLYQPDQSFFTPDLNEEYRIRVSYWPDQGLAGYKGFVYFQSGGSK